MVEGNNDSRKEPSARLRIGRACGVIEDGSFFFIAIFLQEAEKLDASARVLEMITDGALTATSKR